MMIGLLSITSEYECGEDECWQPVAFGDCHCRITPSMQLHQRYFTDCYIMEGRTSVQLGNLGGDRKQVT